MYLMMWEFFEADLRTSPEKSLGTLLHPESGILRHARDINICDDVDPIMEQRVQLLLSALPPGRLREFESSSPLSSFTLKLLLQSQRKIQAIYSFICQRTTTS